MAFACAFETASSSKRNAPRGAGRAAGDARRAGEQRIELADSELQVRRLAFELQVEVAGARHRSGRLQLRHAGDRPPRQLGEAPEIGRAQGEAPVEPRRRGGAGKACGRAGEHRFEIVEPDRHAGRPGAARHDAHHRAERRGDGGIGRLHVRRRAAQLERRRALCRHGKVARLAACHQRKLADRAECAFHARGRRIDPPRRSRAGGEPDGGLELRDRNAAGHEGQRRAARLPEPQRKLRGGGHEIGRERAARLQLGAARGERRGLQADRAVAAARHVEGEAAVAGKQRGIFLRHHVLQRAGQVGGDAVAGIGAGDRRAAGEHARAGRLHLQVGAPVRQRTLAVHADVDRRAAAQAQEIGEQAALRLGELQLGGQHVARRLQAQVGREACRAGRAARPRAVLP